MSRHLDLPRPLALALAPALALAIPAAVLTPGAAAAAPMVSKSGIPLPPVPPWPGEPPQLKVVDSPCPGPECQAELTPPGGDPAALGRRIVYLNFEGGEFTPSNSNDDARSNTSAIVTAPMSIPRFETWALSFDGDLTREQVIQITVDQLEDSYSSFDVQFVTERPQSGNYHMIVFAGPGQNCANTAGASCAGIALRDCQEVMPNNIVWVFADGLRYADLAQVAAHEAGHAFGLDHIDNNDAIMYWSVQNHVTTQFQAGPINPPDVESACFGNTFQDSPERLMDNIGPRGQDVLAPEIELLTPAEGDTMVAGSPVVGTATDIDSEVASMALVINGQEVTSKNSQPWEFSIPADIALGEGTVRLEATDVSGNVSFKQVRVTFASDIPCSAPEDCPQGLRCGDDNMCEPGSVAGSLGSLCTTNEECASGLCGSVEGESRCTQPCDEATACPGGFECLGGAACWPADGSGGGCSVTSDRSLPGLLLLAMGVVAISLRRRRR